MPLRHLVWFILLLNCPTTVRIHPQTNQQKTEEKIVIIPKETKPEEQCEIYYKTIGSGKPIVLIHGFMPDHQLMLGCMEPVFENREGYRRIYFDLPGMGLSKSEPWIDTSDEMLAIVVTFIEKILPEQSFLLAGESYGGYILRGIISKFPKRVDGALFICPLIIPYRNKRDVPDRTIIHVDLNFVKTLTETDSESFKNMVVNQNQETWHRFQEEIISGLGLADILFLAKIQKDGYNFSFNVDKKIDSFTKPVLFLLGRQDNTVGYKDAWKILEKYPRATFAVLDVAGHNLQIEQPELFNALATEWLERVKKYSD